MSRVDFFLCTASIGLIGVTFYQMSRAQSARSAPVKTPIKSADVSSSDIAADGDGKTSVGKATAPNIPKPAVTSQTGEIYFGPVTFKDRKTAEAYLRQFQPEGDIQHVVEPEDTSPK